MDTEIKVHPNKQYHKESSGEDRRAREREGEEITHSMVTLCLSVAIAIGI